MSSIRIDRYAPEWALGILEDLDTGYPGREAVARAAGRLREQADQTAQRATEADAKATAWEAVRGTWICAETLAREHRERAAEFRQYESYLRATAAAVAGLRGEYIAVAGLLR